MSPCAGPSKGFLHTGPADAHTHVAAHQHPHGNADPVSNADGHNYADEQSDTDRN